ncbi:3-deoxy-D-manno-octulosonic acid transferase [Candidatus Omnitrophota bacterium]
MTILYDLAFIIFAIGYLPYLLLKRKLHKGLFQRLGFLPESLRLEQPVWIHAVSVGEARVAGILVEQLRRDFPGKRFAFSTITVTGSKIVRSFLQKGDFLFYLPFDLSLIVRKVISRLKPCACIIVETEIWPNLIYQLKKMNVPVILVNARISDRSFSGYRTIRPLIKPILNKVNLFCVQGQSDARRLSSLGVDTDRLRVTGNMKFDFLQCSQGIKGDYTNYKLRLGLETKEKLFIAGSTHPGEEEVILNTYKKLLDEFPGLRLLLAPRHPERAGQAAGEAVKFGFQAVLISTLTNSAQQATQAQGDRSRQPPVFILDTIGELMSFYAIADIVFVGGSLVKKGGHNILEPALCAKPILFGPHMFNFREMSELFLAQKAARMVRGQEELFIEMKNLLTDSSQLMNIGKQARELVLKNQGATSQNAELIKGLVAV